MTDPRATENRTGDTPRVAEPTTGAESCPLCGARADHELARVGRDALVEIYGADLARVLEEELAEVQLIRLILCHRCDLRFFAPPAPGSARLYEALREQEDYYQSDKPEFEFARPLIRPEHAVLEIGCGDGAFGASIRPRSYIGLELTPASAAAARARGLDVREEPLGSHAALHAGRYDAVCAFQVLEHLGAPGRFISDCLITLKPGGSLIVSVPSADSFASRIPNFALDLPPHHITRWSDECLRGLGRFFPMQLTSLWHEKLQSRHRRMYASAALMAFGYGLRGRSVPVVDQGRFAGAIVRLTWILSAGLAPLVPILGSPRGISVVAVYRRME